jgi:hexosaminidase
MLLRDWGDYGHYEPLSLSWYPYLFGAATAWTGARTSPEEFDAAFAELFLGLPVGDVAVSAMRRLGKAVTGPTLGLPNRSALTLALFDDPLAAPRSAQLDGRALSEVAAAADDAVAAFAVLPEAELRHDYGFVARLVAFAAAKALEARQHQSVESLERDRARAAALRSEFESVRLRHARRSEIHLTLQHFDALDNAHAAASAWVGHSNASRVSTFRRNSRLCGSRDMPSSTTWRN